MSGRSISLSVSAAITGAEDPFLAAYFVNLFRNDCFGVKKLCASESRCCSALISPPGNVRVT